MVRWLLKRSFGKRHKWFCMLCSWAFWYCPVFAVCLWRHFFQSRRGETEWQTGSYPKKMCYVEFDQGCHDSLVILRDQSCACVSTSFGKKWYSPKKETLWRKPLSPEKETNFVILPRRKFSTQIFTQNLYLARCLFLSLPSSRSVGIPIQAIVMPIKYISCSVFVRSWTHSLCLYTISGSKAVKPKKVKILDYP